MATRTITITGSSGFVGQILCRHLPAMGFDLRPFDQISGARAFVLCRRFFGTAQSGPAAFLSNHARAVQRKFGAATERRASGDDILALRSELTRRFRGSFAVIHLAAIPRRFHHLAHRDDFRRINYDGTVNVFEAARAAGVEKFVFASCAEVYALDPSPRIDQFPILETNPLPALADRQTMFGFLKAEAERYFERVSVKGTMQAISLRLDHPGLRSTSESNLFTSATIENTVRAFASALKASPNFSAESFNVCNAVVDPGVVDVQQFLRERYPSVPNHVKGNGSLLSVEKARAMLDYDPQPEGTYFRADIAL